MKKVLKIIGIIFLVLIIILGILAIKGYIESQQPVYEDDYYKYLAFNIILLLTNFIKYFESFFIKPTS